MMCGQSGDGDVWRQSVESRALDWGRTTSEPGNVPEPEPGLGTSGAPATGAGAGPG